MDRATYIGLMAGFGLLGTAVFLGGDSSAFFDLRALLIVIGGTFAITLVSFTFKEFRDATSAALSTLSTNANSPQTVAKKLLRLSDMARKTGGVRDIERQLPQFRNDVFLSKALTMVVDGLNPDDLERVLGAELDAFKTRRAKSAAVLRRAAEVAPAMGLIGTLVGLVQMLAALDNPAGIGPAMAVALLTTFYGAVLGNMMFAPLASKLERNSEADLARLSLYAVSAASMGRQESPRHLVRLLNSMLPPTEQIHNFNPSSS